MGVSPAGITGRRSGGRDRGRGPRAVPVTLTVTVTPTTEAVAKPKSQRVLTSRWRGQVSGAWSEAFGTECAVDYSRENARPWPGNHRPFRLSRRHKKRVSEPICAERTALRAGGNQGFLVDLLAFWKVHREEKTTSELLSWRDGLEPFGREEPGFYTTNGWRTHRNVQTALPPSSSVNLRTLRGESLTTIDSRSGPNALDGPHAQTTVASQTKLGIPEHIPCRTFLVRGL